MPVAKHTDSMLKEGTFEGMTTVITGGGTGLGRSVGEYLLSLGGNLAICGRRKDVVEKTAAKMESHLPTNRESPKGRRLASAGLARTMQLTASAAGT